MQSMLSGAFSKIFSLASQCLAGQWLRLGGLPMAAALACIAGSSLAQTVAPVVPQELEKQDPDIDIYALMTGKCPTLKIAGRDYACKVVGFFHGEHGRVNFTVVLDDPTDSNHIISFSGMNGQRSDDNVYQLPIDRMLLNSKDRPKTDGMPVPRVELSAGSCKQVGSFAARLISSITCTASDKHGKTYELKFVSDGSPMAVTRIRQTSVSSQDPFTRELLK
jgi:hypothetical protein